MKSNFSALCEQSMSRNLWTFLCVLALTATTTVLVARVSFTHEGIVFRKACAALDRIRSGTTYTQCRLELFAAANRDASTVAFGDSITELQDWARNFPRHSIANRGVSGSQIQDVIRTIDAVKLAGNETVILLIGVNDVLVADRKATEIILDFENLIKKLQARNIRSDQIIVQSVILCNSSKLRCSVERRTEIIALNRRIEHLCDAKRLKFVDLNKNLAPTGTLERAFSDDGLHLNVSGNRAWADALASAL
jgi:lysophospholipase L1-like esterase